VDFTQCSAGKSYDRCNTLMQLWRATLFHGSFQFLDQHGDLKAIKDRVSVWINEAEAFGCAGIAGRNKSS